MDAELIASEKKAKDLFVSEGFINLKGLINEWKIMRKANAIKFAAMLNTRKKEEQDKAAQTLLLLWPFLHTVVENLKRER